jgi:hypothetical protein
MEGRDATRVRCIAPYTAIFGVIQQLSIQRNILYSKSAYAAPAHTSQCACACSCTCLRPPRQARAVLVHCRLRRARLGLAPRAPGDISDDDLKQLVTDVAMKSGHAARLRTALPSAAVAAVAAVTGAAASSPAAEPAAEPAVTPTTDPAANPAAEPATEPPSGLPKPVVRPGQAARRSSQQNFDV